MRSSWAGRSGAFTFMAATVLVLLLGASRAQAGAISDGSCNPQPQENLSTLASVLAAAEQLARGCIPVEDPRRPHAEANERRAIENAFGAFVKSACADRICVNNGWGFLLDAYDDERYGMNTLLAGCGRWAGEVSQAASEGPSKYWEIREAQYGKDSGRPGYHWVVEMRNTRTGETFILDGYEASKSGRNLLGSNMTNPDRLRRAGGIRTPQDVEKQWGKRNDASYGCQNAPGSLCDRSGC